MCVRVCVCFFLFSQHCFCCLTHWPPSSTKLFVVWPPHARSSTNKECPTRTTLIREGRLWGVRDVNPNHRPLPPRQPPPGHPYLHDTLANKNVHDSTHDWSKQRAQRADYLLTSRVRDCLATTAPVGRP